MYSNKHNIGENSENAILALLFLTMCRFLGSGHLLGAFVPVWHHQINHVLQWMLRILFSATIGFAIQIQEKICQLRSRREDFHGLLKLDASGDNLIFIGPHWVVAAISCAKWGECRLRDIIEECGKNVDGLSKI